MVRFFGELSKDQLRDLSLLKVLANLIPPISQRFVYEQLLCKLRAESGKIHFRPGFVMKPQTIHLINEFLLIQSNQMPMIGIGEDVRGPPPVPPPPPPPSRPPGPHPHGEPGLPPAPPHSHLGHRLAASQTASNATTLPTSNGGNSGGDVRRGGGQNEGHRQVPPRQPFADYAPTQYLFQAVAIATDFEKKKKEEEIAKHKSPLSCPRQQSVPTVRQLPHSPTSAFVPVSTASRVQLEDIERDVLQKESVPSPIIKPVAIHKSPKSSISNR